MIEPRAGMHLLKRVVCRLHRRALGEEEFLGRGRNKEVADIDVRDARLPKNQIVGDDGEERKVGKAVSKYHQLGFPVIYSQVALTLTAKRKYAN